MENIKLRRRRDLTGQKFGRLIVLEAGQKRTPNRGMYWLCECECGSINEVAAQALVKGSVVSCGCYHREVVSGKIKHGHNRRHSKKSPTYITWTKMNDRCNNPLVREYKWYGGRGISVCKRWRSFVNFLSDMGERPEGKTLDRINPNGNYNKTNCRWAAPLEQANNTRRNQFLQHDSQVKTIAEWARVLNLNYDTLYRRVRKGATLSDAQIFSNVLFRGKRKSSANLPIGLKLNIFKK